MDEYFVELNDLIASIASLRRPRFSVMAETPSGAGKVLKGRLEKWASPTYGWVSDIANVTADQVDYVDKLISGEIDFVTELDDPTGKPETTRVIRNTTKELGAPSVLTRTEAIFFPRLSMFDREYVFVSAVSAINDTCTMRVFPSVSERWIRFSLKDRKAARQVAMGSFLFRGLNLYPSGDRFCVTDRGDGFFDIQYAHIVTTRIGGMLGLLRVFELGLFDSFVRDTYLQETQGLENQLDSIRTNSLV